MARLVTFVVVVFIVAVVSAEEEVDQRSIGHLPSITAPASFRPALSSLISHIPIPGRPGLCPYVRRLLPAGSHNSASVCGNFCVNDLMCLPGHKCCPTECGYACFAAVRAMH